MCNNVFQLDFADLAVVRVDRLQYKDGWPFIETQSPGIQSKPVPIIRKKINTK